MNRTLVALIPKTENPETISQFRPIGLRNVSYKVIAKIIVNRIRPHLDTQLLAAPFNPVS